jgi:hypothetical protein
MNASGDFDNWLEAELDKGFARSTQLSKAKVDGYHGFVPRGQGSQRISTGRPFVGKAAMALAAATLSLGTVGAAAATAVTHSANPQVWGQQVENAVADCKTALSSGQHGIGDCVTAFAKQRGSAHRAGHGHGNGKKKSHPEASSGPDNEVQPDTSHGHGGQLKSGKSQDSTPQGTPNGQESPTTP